MGYRYTPAAVTADSNLWKYVSGAAPDQIELNTGAGVTGIEATNPVGTTLALWLSTLLGTPVAVFKHESGADLLVSGIAEDVGNKIAVNLLINGADVVTSGVDVLMDAGMQAVDANLFGDFFVNKTFMTSNQGNLASGDNVEEGRTKDDKFVKVEVAGVKTLQWLINKDKFAISGAGADVFRILPTGEIRTNQIAATAHAVAAGQLRVTDIAGNAVFINCFTP